MRRLAAHVRSLCLLLVLVAWGCGPADFEENRPTYQRAAELVLQNDGQTTPELQRLTGELGIDQVYYDADDQIVALRWNGGFILGMREYLYHAGGDSLATFANNTTGYTRTHLGGNWYYQELTIGGPEQSSTSSPSSETASTPE